MTGEGIQALGVPENPSLRTQLDTPRALMRPARAADVSALRDYLRRNAAYLAPWTPTTSRALIDAQSLTAVSQLISARLRDWKLGSAYMFVVEPKTPAHPERAATRRPIIGRLTLSQVVRGPLQSASLGYQIDQTHAGTGMTTECSRALVAFAFETLKLHRLHAGVMPANVASIRVLEKLGFRLEGRALRYLHIAGKWEDHLLYALTTEEWRSP